MKKTILILLLLMSTVAFTQEIKKCVEVKVEKLDTYRVKVTKTNNCVEPKEINSNKIKIVFFILFVFFKH